MLSLSTCSTPCCSTRADSTRSESTSTDYSRAKRLLAAAKKTVAEYDGILPSSPKVLEKEVPGIGPYTAGAIASIAYNVQTPLVRPPCALELLLHGQS
jgi:hypothetical protein